MFEATWQSLIKTQLLLSDAKVTLKGGQRLTAAAEQVTEF